MTPLLFLAVALGGGLGAACRFALDGLIRTRIGGSLPVGTIIINLTGSLALGFVTGLATGHILSGAAQAVIGVGFLGGYTTFSTASYQTVELARDGKSVQGIASGIGVLVTATVLAGLGWWFGSLL